MSLLETIYDVIRLCDCASFLERDGAYDEKGQSTITATVGIPPDSPTNCYALNTLSRWKESIERGTEMDLRSNLNAIDWDLCYQSLLKLVSKVQEPVTIIFCRICHVLTQKVKSIELYDDCNLLTNQIKASMDLIRILIGGNGIDQRSSLMNPIPDSLIALLETVYDLSSAHSVRNATLESIYGAVLSWLHDSPYNPPFCDIPRGLITMNISIACGAVVFLCRPAIFVDLLFRGARPFAFQFGGADPDLVHALEFAFHPARMQLLHQKLYQRMAPFPGATLDTDFVERILLLNAPKLIFPFIERAKQQMLCILVESEAAIVGTPEMASIIVSFLFIEGEDEYFSDFPEFEKASNLDLNSLEYFNWIRMMSHDSTIAREQWKYFQNIEYERDLVDCANKKYLVFDYDDSDLKHIHQLIRQNPPKFEIYQKFLWNVVGSNSIACKNETFHLEIIDWLKHMETVYPQCYDINMACNQVKSPSNLLMFTLDIMLSKWLHEAPTFEPNPGCIKLILYLLKETKSAIDFDHFEFIALLRFCADGTSCDAMEILSIMLQRAPKGIWTESRTETKRPNSPQDET